MPGSESARTRSLAATAVSGHLDTRTAAMEVAHGLHDVIGSSCDLALVFASFHHRAALAEAVREIRMTTNPRTTLAVTTEGVVGNDFELEGVAGISAIAMQLPGVTLTPWLGTPTDPMPVRERENLAARIGLAYDYRATLFFGDPFSTPITKLLPALTACGGDGQRVPVIGGMASGASQPGQNVLVIDDRVVPAGVIGVGIAGDVAVDAVVSQGCRPIGEPYVVTRAEKNLVLELGGRPALGALEGLFESADEHERELLRQGVMLGHVIDEHARPFGRGDFLVRNLIGAKKDQKGILVGEFIRAGQTVQFHVRDAVTADEDLQLLLDAEVLKPRPFGGLLFTCNGRGRKLFETEHHDVNVIHDRLGPVPLAGFFAAGEIGPVGDRSFLHGQTASLAFFRER